MTQLTRRELLALVPALAAAGPGPVTQAKPATPLICELGLQEMAQLLRTPQVVRAGGHADAPRTD